MKPTPPREADIQRAVMDLLRARGFRIFRRNVAGVQHMPNGGVMRVGEAGQADLYGWSVNFQHPGTSIHLEVEVKRPGNKPTPAQLAWIHSAVLDGAIAFWCDSVEVADAKLRDFGW